MPIPVSEEFRKRFDAVSTDVQLLNYYWLTFTGLFWNDDDRVELYTNTAPNVLRFLREAVLDVIMIASARLCDPAAIGKRRNLNLRSIAGESELAPIKSELDACLALLASHYKPVKDWRDKRLTHTDAETRMGYFQLPDLPYQHLKELIQHITEFANLIYKHVADATHGFSTPGYRGGPDELIYFLRKGYEAHLNEKQQKEVS